MVFRVNHSMAPAGGFAVVSGLFTTSSFRAPNQATETFLVVMAAAAFAAALSVAASRTKATPDGLRTGAWRPLTLQWHQINKFAMVRRGVVGWWQVVAVTDIGFVALSGVRGLGGTGRSGAGQAALALEQLRETYLVAGQPVPG